MDGDTVYIESNDGVNNDRLRLKEFADVRIQDRQIIIESRERLDKKRPIVHWLPHNSSLPGTLTYSKDDQLFTIEGRIEQHELEPGTMVQLERIGYAKVIDSTSLFLSYEE